MKEILGMLLLLTSILNIGGCSEDRPTAPLGDLERDVDDVSKLPPETESGTKENLLIWTITYDNENVFEEYEYYLHPENNDRIKHGWYRSYYENKEHKEIGSYKDGVKDGVWSSYDEDGNVTEGEYKDGLRWSGQFWLFVEEKFQADGGRIRSVFEETEETSEALLLFKAEISFSNGKWNGVAIFYRSVNGQYYLFSKMNFVDGKLEGLRVYYDPRGELFGEENYENGFKEGKQVFYSADDGSVISESVWENGICVDCN